MKTLMLIAALLALMVAECSAQKVVKYLDLNKQPRTKIVSFKNDTLRYKYIDTSGVEVERIAGYNVKKDEFLNYKSYVNLERNFAFITRLFSKVIDGTMFLHASYYDEDWLFMNHVYILVGGKSYDSRIFANYDEDVQREVVSDGVYEEILLCSGSNSSLIRVIAQNTDKVIKVRYYGNKYYHDYVLDEYLKMTIADDYWLSLYLNSPNKK